MLKVLLFQQFLFDTLLSDEKRVVYGAAKCLFLPPKDVDLDGWSVMVLKAGMQFFSFEPNDFLMLPDCPRTACGDIMLLETGLAAEFCSASWPGERERHETHLDEEDSDCVGFFTALSESRAILRGGWLFGMLRIDRNLASPKWFHFCNLVLGMAFCSWGFLFCWLEGLICFFKLLLIRGESAGDDKLVHMLDSSGWESSMCSLETSPPGMTPRIYSNKCISMQYISLISPIKGTARLQKHHQNMYFRSFVFSFRKMNLKSWYVISYQLPSLKVQLCDREMQRCEISSGY